MGNTRGVADGFATGVLDLRTLGTRFIRLLSPWGAQSTREDGDSNGMHHEMRRTDIRNTKTTELVSVFFAGFWGAVVGLEAQRTTSWLCPPPRDIVSLTVMLSPGVAPCWGPSRQPSRNPAI